MNPEVRDQDRATRDVVEWAGNANRSIGYREIPNQPSDTPFDSPAGSGFPPFLIGFLL